MLKKIESQLLSYNGKDKLTVDEYYNVLKVQVLIYNWWKYQTSILYIFTPSSKSIALKMTSGKWSLIYPWTNITKS